MKTIAPFLVIIVFLVAMAVVFINLFNYRLKKRLIETGNIDESTVSYLFRTSGFRYEVLKWGLVLFFGGLGLVILEFIPYKDNHSPLPYGVESIFISLGFIVYYLIIRKEK